MPVVVEYLLIMPQADTFCDSEEAFSRLLRVDTSISISGGKIRHDETFECDYRLASGLIETKGQRFFHLHFCSEPVDLQSLQRFSALLRTIRSILEKTAGQAETLWDDISFQYSRLGYELIHRIENLMRKLIANFMLVNVGNGWANETSPDEVKAAFNNSKRKDVINVLHTVDFIHLKDFLLKPYSEKTPHELLEGFRKAATIEQFQAVQGALPRSNWSRYFSALVDCDDAYLRKRWDELYDLRCKVAHNAIVTKSDFDRITLLIGELQGKIEAAIQKLPQLRVPVDEVQNVVDNVAITRSTLVGEFFAAWQLLESAMFTLAYEFGWTKGRGPSIRDAVEHLHRAGLVKREEVVRLNSLRQLRNEIVHLGGPDIPDAMLRAAIEDTLYLAMLHRRGNDTESPERPPKE